MVFLKMVIGTMVSIVALTLALYLAGVVLKIAFFAFWLVKVAIVFGFLALIAWLVYRLISPKTA
jgi:hypothetical protein